MKKKQNISNHDQNTNANVQSDWWWRWRRNVSFSLSASLSLFSALTLSSHAHLWSLKLSLKMRVSSNELFSTLKYSRVPNKVGPRTVRLEFHLNIIYYKNDPRLENWVKNGFTTCKQRLTRRLRYLFLASVAKQEKTVRLPTMKTTSSAALLTSKGLDAYG